MVKITQGLCGLLISTWCQHLNNQTLTKARKDYAQAEYEHDGNERERYMTCMCYFFVVL